MFMAIQPMAKGLKRRTIGIIGLVLVLVSAVFYCIAMREFTNNPLVVLIEIFENVPGGTSISEEVTAECDRVMTRFRVNPASYARVYYYGVGAGVSPLVYQYGEKQPKRNIGYGMETKNKDWRVVAECALQADGFWRGIRDISRLCLVAAIIFLIWFIGFPRFEKFRKRSG